MADSPNLPGSHSRPVASDGGWSREWYGYFRDLANFVSVSTTNSVSLEAITAQLTALEEAVDGLATQEQPTLNAPFSVVIDGSLESGAALFRLDGDVVAPAAYTYYGMGDDAANGKGFWPVPVISVNDAQGVVILNNTETVSTATRDLIQADRDKYLRFTFSGAKTFTVIEEATDQITQDTLVTGRVVGSGDLTIVEDGVVVVNPPAGGSLVIPPDTTFTLLRVAEDVWDMFYAPVASNATEAVTALSIASGVVNIDCSLGKHFTLALTANVTSITFSNLPASGEAGEIAIRMRQDGTGSWTVALPSSFKATGGSDTAVQSAANAYTLLTAITFDQGTRWEYAMQEIAA
jgi:hypothetical protein